MTEVTKLISQIQNGNQAASDELLPLVYAELRKLAAAKMAGERKNHTLAPTALVHEAYLRLISAENNRVFLECSETIGPAVTHDWLAWKE